MSTVLSGGAIGTEARYSGAELTVKTPSKMDCIARRAIIAAVLKENNYDSSFYNQF